MVDPLNTSQLRRFLRPPAPFTTNHILCATMALEDFEKSLAKEKAKERDERSYQHQGAARKRQRHHHHHHHQDRDQHHHRRKRREHSADSSEQEHHRRKRRHHGLRQGEEAEVEKERKTMENTATFNPVQSTTLTRDSWMEAPSSLQTDYTQKAYQKPPEPIIQTSTKKDFQLKIHDNELNKHHLQELADGRDVPEEVGDAPVTHEVNYIIGDAGSQWRMKKLKRVYERAEEEHKAVDDVAIEQFGDLRSFDDAREEQIELDRRDTYGAGFLGKEKPNGDLFAERRIELGETRRPQATQAEDEAEDALDKTLETVSAPVTTVSLDQTALNRLKAQMMKAKLRGGPQAAALEAEYDAAVAASSANPKKADVLVLKAMESRALASGRSGEVKPIDNKRGRERGLVEENEDMSVSDMVREERRTRTHAGGDSARFAERIAKDGKFSSDLDYMDENAAKLAKRVEKSDLNLKTTAISDFHALNRILDSCPLCHHEDTNQSPVAPVVSLATRVYLTLPTQPELSPGSAAIIPIQHRANLLECDDDEWEEVRNFMKSLTRMYHDQGRSVLFYENAANAGGNQGRRRRHASMEVVPLPYALGGLAPQFFKEAILAADEEWTQHRKLIDTLAKSRDGMGKSAFRRTLVKEMPYFHVWFELDGGLGHVVEDADRWPKGDLFAREVVGGMLDVGPEVVKRQGRWKKGAVDERVEPFRRKWRKFDWTRVLVDG